MSFAAPADPIRAGLGLALVAGLALLAVPVAPAQEGAGVQDAAPDAAVGRALTPFEREDVTAVAEKLACYCGCPHMQVSTCFCGTADQIRRDIAAHLDSGGSPDAFVAAYVAEHGTWGLAVPPREGFNLLVWVLPPVMLLAGLGLVVVLAIRLRRQAIARPATGVEPSAAADEEVRAADRHRDRLEEMVRED